MTGAAGIVATIGALLATCAGAAAQNPPARQSPASGAVASRVDTPPSEATLGVALFPNAQFLRSYDAGRGQRFFLYGTSASFAEVVAYYKTVLKQRGYFIYEISPTHSFEVGRFRAESMAFPPCVTIKDFTSSGSQGYPNPRAARFATVIQIVPVPPE